MWAFNADSASPGYPFLLADEISGTGHVDASLPDFWKAFDRLSYSKL